MSPAFTHRPGLRAHARRRRLPARLARAGADRGAARARGLAGAARRCCRLDRARRRGWSRRCSAITALILLAELLGTFAAFEAWTMIAGALVAGRRGASGRRAAAPAGGAVPAPPAPPASRIAVWLAAGAVRGGRRGLDGADARQPRRRHGPRRHALVPHAARGPVRRRRALRLDRLLRPDLLRLVLPGELRGRARGPDPRLRPRHPLAAAQPRLARARPDRRLRDRPPLRRRPAEPDRRRDRARRPEPGRVPGGRGAQRHRRRRADPLRGRGARERLGRATAGDEATSRRVVGDARNSPSAPAALAVAGLAAGLAAGTKLSLPGPCDLPCSSG